MKRKLLYIDFDHLCGKEATPIFEKEGFKVTFFKSMYSALGEVQSGKANYDIVLFDDFEYRFNNGMGTVSDYLRGKLPNTPLVEFSADPLMGEKVNASLIKPAPVKDIIATLNELAPPTNRNGKGLLSRVLNGASSLLGSPTRHTEISSLQDYLTKTA